MILGALPDGRQPGSAVCSGISICLLHLHESLLILLGSHMHGALITSI